jgi:hypothetical protein
MKTATTLDNQIKQVMSNINSDNCFNLTSVHWKELTKAVREEGGSKALFWIFLTAWVMTNLELLRTNNSTIKEVLLASKVNKTSVPDLVELSSSFL